MTKKIKVVHHSKSIGYSGTDRTAQIFCKYLARSERFEPYIVYRRNHGCDERLDVARNWLGADHVIGYEWSPGKSGRVSPFIPEHETLSEILRQLNPDIVHVHRSGYAEWPAFKSMAPSAKWVETNIFGEVDRREEMDLNIYISDYIRRRAMERGGPNGPVVYNPIEQPTMDITPETKEECREELLEKYKIPRNAVLLGRVGRADNYDPISLNALATLKDMGVDNAYYIVVNPCERWRTDAEKKRISNIRFADPIVDDRELSRFYRGLDIYAHARHDGECCPCNIQEAMMHRLPIVSHESAIYNGQAEIIGPAGFVVPVGDHVSYAGVLHELINNTVLMNDETGLEVGMREHFGLEARRRAMRYFDAECVTSQLEKIYGWVVDNA